MSTVSSFQIGKQHKSSGENQLESEVFFKTIKLRGFLVKATTEQLIARAKIFEYDHLCNRIEEMMALFVQSNYQLTFATFIINYLLQTEHEIKLVE